MINKYFNTLTLILCQSEMKSDSNDYWFLISFFFHGTNALVVSWYSL